MQRRRLPVPSGDLKIPGLPAGTIGAIIGRASILIGGIMFPSDVAPGVLSERDIKYVLERNKAAKEATKANSPEKPATRVTPQPQRLEEIVVTARRLPNIKLEELPRAALPTQATPRPAPSQSRSTSRSPSRSIGQRVRTWTQIIAGLSQLSRTSRRLAADPLSAGNPFGPGPDPLTPPGSLPGSTTQPQQRSSAPNFNGLCEGLQRQKREKKKSRRKCVSRAKIRWADGPKAGQFAGTKCLKSIKVR